jgi:hypothetical protein
MENMKIKGYNTQGTAIVNVKDYYRDDYEMLQDILSCRWSEVLILGLRRFGKTSLLRRIDGFVNKREDYRVFLEKGLNEWNREIDGNPPRKEFFDELKSLEARAFYLSFLDPYDFIEEKIIDFFKQLGAGTPMERFKLEKIEASLPPKLFILMDEFSKLAELTKESEKKREFFLTLHRSAQNLSKEIVFVIAEPPSIFSAFEMSIKKDSSITEVTDALQNRKIFSLNGLSPHEKLNLFCLKKSENYGGNVDENKIRDVLEQLSGIPLEIQIAGESFFNHPEKETKDILQDVAEAFGGNLKSIIFTMNLQQRVFIRVLTEFEMEGGGIPWERVKKTSHRLFENLRNFGMVKKDREELVRFTSEPIRSILCGEMEKLSDIVDDENYYKELKTMVISEEEKQMFVSPGHDPWDGRIRIHHFSDLSLGNLIKGFNYNESTQKLDLFSLNDKENPFEAYFKLLKSHSRYKPHILVFTGDIALSHHSYCYRGFKEFIIEILDLMNPLPGERSVIPGKQVILVPGEMDISNPAGKGCDNPKGIDMLDSCNFVDFFRAFKDYGIPPENASQNGLDKIITIELPSTHGISGYSLEILPFNSATMVWPKQINLRRLDFLEGLKNTLGKNDEKIIKEGLEQFLGDEIGFINMEDIERDTNKVENLDDTLRIAVTHHNLNPQKVRHEHYTVDTLNAYEAKTLLLQKLFSIILHGHQRSPIFVKETLYKKEQNDPKDRKGLKTLFMNGAGKFTETRYDVDDTPFGPSFNSYDIRRIDNRDGEIGRYRGDFKVQSTVFTYQREENKFVRDQQVVKEEIFIDED